MPENVVYSSVMIRSNAGIFCHSMRAKTRIDVRWFSVQSPFNPRSNSVPPSLQLRSGFVRAPFGKPELAKLQRRSNEVEENKQPLQVYFSPGMLLVKKITQTANGTSFFQKNLHFNVKSECSVYITEAETSLLFLSILNIDMRICIQASKDWHFNQIISCLFQFFEHISICFV